MKRYCQRLILVDDVEMIRQYVEVHAHVWPEVIAGQREVGILDMHIYRHGRDLFMIMDTVDEFVFCQGCGSPRHPSSSGGMGSLCLSFPGK